ncbi:hypothetical protein M404DRAFT_1000474 [Pisolithus tinctorius Marx 270]|uniref:Uncharacterized protein n=1 Tax=Pisolithus tinctorius Marx 270 TaxID=870435 RepID=A0A0C3J6D9_PISTI|nr:hypothetical protein M404DRAFT_1000474 [Pisolithus tinctorius Marx 270]
MQNTFAGKRGHGPSEAEGNDGFILSLILCSFPVHCAFAQTAGATHTVNHAAVTDRAQAVM